MLHPLCNLDGDRHGDGMCKKSFMARSHCTEPGQGQGPGCNVHMAQGLGLETILGNIIHVTEIHDKVYREIFQVLKNWLKTH